MHEVTNGRIADLDAEGGCRPERRMREVTNGRIADLDAEGGRRPRGMDAPSLSRPVRHYFERSPMGGLFSFLGGKSLL
jgi:hypothetical protein